MQHSRLAASTRCQRPSRTVCILVVTEAKHAVSQSRSRSQRPLEQCQGSGCSNADVSLLAPAEQRRHHRAAPASAGGGRGGSRALPGSALCDAPGACRAIIPRRSRRWRDGGECLAVPPLRLPLSHCCLCGCAGDISARCDLQMLPVNEFCTTHLEVAEKLHLKLKTEKRLLSNQDPFLSGKLIFFNLLTVHAGTWCRDADRWDHGGRRRRHCVRGFPAIRAAGSAPCAGCHDGAVCHRGCGVPAAAVTVCGSGAG